MITTLWHRPAVIAPNNFKFKSLSCWSYNPAVGCEHACRFCYVPEVSTNKLAAPLGKLGVTNPDAQWGDYVFVRPWDVRAFDKSLLAAAHTPLAQRNPDGNNAIMFSTTTDPYQTIANPAVHRQLQQNVEHALMRILDQTNLNVRILTRSPLARRDFDLMGRFGSRLLFGMSLPTLHNKLARIYEPKAPAPTQRLATLQAAKAAGLHVYVAVAPVYPECDAEDMAATLAAVKDLDPVTVFMEPINIRAENIARIEAHALSLGETLQTGVFKTPQVWRAYAVDQLLTFERLAQQAGLADRLHLWPDASLGSRDAVAQFHHNGFDDYLPWLRSHWDKISHWPQ